MMLIGKTLKFIVVGLFLWGTALGQADLSRRLNMARSLVRQRRVEEAVKVYEELYRDYPDNLRIHQNLSNTYLATKRYDELIQISQEALKDNPGNLIMLRYLGRAYLGKGERKKGMEVVEKMIALNPEGRGNYQIAASLLVSSKNFDEAIDLYLKGRRALGDEILFAGELAFAYQLKGDYESAASELLSLLKANPRQALWVERQIKAMLKKGDPAKIVRVLEKESLKDVPPQFHKILGDIYLSQGEYEAASKEYESSGGVDALVQLGKRAEEEGLYQVAVTTYQRALQTSKDPRVVSEASLRIGISLRRLGRFEEALESFELTASRYPQVRGEALYEIGEMWLEDLEEPKKAVPRFEELFKRPGEKLGAEAGLSLVDCWLKLGELGKAEGVCHKLSPLKPDMATFLLAEIQYYRGEFEEAVRLYREVVEQHKGSEVVNDALERILLVGESGGDELKDYAKAELLGAQGRFNEGLDLLRTVIRRDPSLAPRATFLIGNLLKEKGEPHQAIGAYEDLINNYPDSPLCPYAKLEIGEIYATRLKARDRGIEELESLLVEYPSSPLCDLVRDRIEELKGL